MTTWLRISVFGALACLSAAVVSQPESFSQAKRLLPGIYESHSESFYCGCDIEFVEDDEVVDLGSCGYEPRKQPKRANTIEWEHVMPAHRFGNRLPCWVADGRDECQSRNGIFEVMEADLYNLVPAVGEVNGDRSNYAFGVTLGVEPQYGECPFSVDFSRDTVEPRESVRGFIARTYFYMSDQYGIELTERTESLMLRWDRAHPVTTWERRRADLIEPLMGHTNPYVTGQKRWIKGYEPSASLPTGQVETRPLDEPIRGHTGSRLYHLPTGCPSYSRISERNIRKFDSEEAAQAAGYTKAGNCH